MKDQDVIECRVYECLLLMSTLLSVEFVDNSSGSTQKMRVALYVS